MLVIGSLENDEEFPRSFLIGWYEGFWWAFISMTTVGYGDKAPRSYVGRLYSLAWITIGIIAYGTLTGIVYNEVAKVNSPPAADINGKRVGSLMFRDGDAGKISKSGGTPVGSKDLKSFSNSYIDFLNLVIKLEINLLMV